MTKDDTVDRALGRVEGKIDMVLSHITEERERRDRQYVDHEKRIKEGERKVWYASGIVAAVAVFATKLLPH